MYVTSINGVGMSMGGAKNWIAYLRKKEEKVLWM